MRIVFMGTPDFAAESLKRLYDDGYDVPAVFTQPDKPSGRGMKLAPTPVKSAAAGRSAVFQPETLRGGDTERLLRELSPDIIVVVAYGRLLPPEILALPKLGCVNIHASLLPKYRGAAPIQRAILNGETVTGVTSMYMAEELDAGDIILSSSTEIGENETSGELFTRLAALGAEVLSETLALIGRGEAPRTPQKHEEASFAPPLTRELSPIVWWKTKSEILSQIRALNPWPVAKANLRGVDFKVFAARGGADARLDFPGEVASAGKDGIEVACFEGSVIITELSAPNGKRMSAAEYLRGHPMETTNGRAVIQKIALPQDGRTICVSDIHGSLDVFRSLLEKINYSEKDTLLLLGDLYTKGKQGRETLRYIMELAERENVYALRGNCDWIEGWTDENERAWLKGLPHILESDDYIFVHSGIEPGALAEQSAMACMKTDAFLEKCGTFERYVVAGHWPTGNYTRGAMCCNPIIDFDKRVIAIDGGMVVRRTEGQLNAFIIERGGFSFEAADELPVVTVEKDQAASENPFTITWNDRFVEETDGGAKPDAHSNADEFGGASEFGLYRHLATGKLIELARDRVWRDENGRLCANGTNYRLPVKAGERVSVVREYSDRFMAKKDGIIGWVYR